MDDIATRLQLITESLMRRRTVTLSEISRDSVSDIATRLLLLQAESSERVTILIDSGGGDSDAALALCDLMQHLLTVPIRGIAVGACSSSATFVMLYCDERLAMPHAKFVIHSGRINNVSFQMNDTTAESLEQLLSETKRVSEQVIQMYMDKLQKSRAEVEKLIARGDQAFDQEMSAGEAKEIGLVTEIVQGKLDIFSSP